MHKEEQGLEWVVVENSLQGAGRRTGSVRASRDLLVILMRPIGGGGIHRPGLWEADTKHGALGA